MKKATNPKPRKRKPPRIVRLEDLAPRKTVKGGARRLRFGERLEPPVDEASAAEADMKNQRG